jgi:hypothetical protein
MSVRSEGTGLSRLWLGGLALFGIVAGHSLAFWFAAPDPHEHSELLASTGHQYWSMVVAIALGGLVAAASSFTAKLARRRDREYGLTGTFTFVAPRLAMLQMGGFIALEAGERAVVHGGIGHLLGEPVVIAGLVLQVVVALVAAAILALVALTVRAFLGDGPRRPARRAGVLPRPARLLLRPSFQLGVGGGTWRGPPSGF